MAKGARNKNHAEKHHHEEHPSGKNWSPGGKAIPVEHGPRAGGATTATSGLHASSFCEHYSHIDKEQLGGVK